MSDLKEKVLLKKEQYETTLPTLIKIGDPSYFGEHDKLTYNRRFRGKSDWVGKVILEQNKEVYSDMTFETLTLKVYFAPTKEFLQTYIDGQYYKRQSVKSVDIGVDTAEYLLETSHFYEEVNTMADGYWGDVTELKNGSKLEGIIIDLSIPDETYNFDEAMKIIELLFPKN